MHFVPSERILWMLRSVKRLCALVDDSENVERSKKCIEESEIMSDIESCSWEAEFIVVNWLSISIIMKVDVESITEKVLTECVSVEDAEDC